MKKIMCAVCCVIVMGMLMALPSYSQAPDIDENMRTFEGMVASTDPVRSLLVVRGAVPMTFPVSDDTQFVRDGAPIQLLDIEPGDYVFVEYRASASDGFTPAKVMRVTLKYKKGDSW